MDIDYDTLLNASDDESDNGSDVETDTEGLEGPEGPKGPAVISFEQELAESEYLQAIQNKLQQGQIDDYTYMLEKLIIEYKQALKYRHFNIDNEEDNQKVLRIRELKLELQKELLTEKIDEMEFTRKYYNLLKLEYNILLKYEDYSLNSKKNNKQIPDVFDKNIDELMKQEHKYLKKIANDRDVNWPDKPKITKNDTKLMRMQKYMLYHLELNKAYELTKQYIPGYKLKTLETHKIGVETKWIILDSDKFTFENIKNDYLKNTGDSEIFVDPTVEMKLRAIKNVLRTKTREELLNCITNENIINKLSYIETLKNNTVSVMKFREYPETYEKLKMILNEEAKYYKVSKNDLMKDFNKQFFNISPNINLTVLPKTIQPTFYVKIKDNVYNTDLPEQFGELSKQYKIKPSAKGYSFLLKITKNSGKSSNKRISEYAEKGSVVTLSLKPAYFKSDKIASGVIDEKFYDIIKPLPDELYDELKSKNLSPLNTELTKVYELHIPVPELTNKTDGKKTDGKKTKLVRRYEEFNDYLKDLLSILESNFIFFEEQELVRSADIIYTKIQKIKKYLETGVDPELEYSHKYSLTELINTDPIIKKQREIGINKLREYIFQFYPYNEQLNEVLENDIYEFSNKEYLLNIDKIIFIFKEFDDSLDNYINKRISFIELIMLELPFIKPEDDLPDINIDPKKTFNYLYAWSPKSEQYLKHKNVLDTINNDIIQFKNLKEDLSNLEINEIYDQMLEYKQWETSKVKLNTLHIPVKTDPIRNMIFFLKKERNRLMSRRIYRVAKISERIIYRQDLFRIFIKCKLSNFTKSDVITLTESIENIVYSLSDKPDIYYYYINLVKTTYKILCELITEPKVIIPVVTEFIIKEGNLKHINIQRLNTILTVLNENSNNDNNLIIKLLETLRQKELLAYRTSLIEEQNKEPTNYKLKLIQGINKVIESNKNEKKEEMYSIAAKTYIAPVVTNIVPKIQHGSNNFYVPNYYIIGENEYLYGGNFPDFYDNDTNERNYTDDDIFSLAILLKVDYKEDIDIKELYNECIKKLQNSSSYSKQIYPKTVLLDYSPTLIPKKIYTSYINYIYRPRLGVKNPGEIYVVYIDTLKVSYGVPFKYNEYGIPVYSSQFLDESIKQFYYIEGPAEFEEDLSKTKFIVSTMYILVEYKDSYGKIKLLREGVNTKNVKKSPKELFDACNRFTTEIDCNDLNSYGIEKMKCKFVKGKCISLKQQLIEEKKLIEIPKVLFKRLTKNNVTVTDYYKTKLWNEAIKKANDYVTQLIYIKKLTTVQIDQVTLEQRAKLTQYHDFLLGLNTTMKLEKIIEDTNYSNLKIFIEYFTTKPEKEPEKEPGQEQEQGQEQGQEPGQEQEPFPDEIIKYTSIRLPKLVIKNMKLSFRQLKVGTRYLLEDNTVEILLSKTESELEFSKGSNESNESNGSNGSNVSTKFRIGEQSVRQVNTEELIEYTYFKITTDNLELIENPPSNFTYTLIEKDYEVKKNEIVTQQKKKKTKEFPLDILYLTYIEISNEDNKDNKDNTYEKNVIDRNMLYYAMGKVQYGIFEKNNNGLLESFDIFPATIEAKVYALKYSVDLLELSKVIKNEIQLDDVINYYNKVLPTIKTVNQDIIFQLEYGINKKDIKLLNRYIKIAEKQLKNENNEPIAGLIIAAKNVIIIEEQTKKGKSKQEIKNQQKQEKQEKQEKQKEIEPQKVSYVVQRRRKINKDD